MATPPNILIATPTYGDMLTVPYVNSSFQLLLELQSRGIPHTFQFLSCSNIIEGRNTLISLFLHKKEYTHILFWDADMAVHPNACLALLKANHPLSGLIYHKKKVDWANMKAIAARIPEGVDLQSAMLEFNVRYPNQIDGEPVAITVDNGLTEVATLGTGYMLVRRDTVETMVKKFPKLRYNLSKNHVMEINEHVPHWALFNCIVDEQNQRFYSEDYSFCKRWTDDCGGKIYGLVDAEVVHAGQMSLKANYLDKLKSGIP